ncbi:MAG: threonine synthase [Thermodesulfobacteria bacterium]|nr:threonine synthase [Thermodesulfobacteriota bacterium]
MRYISTRGGISPITFSEAVMMGLASDGGLLLPEKLPEATPEQLQRWQGLDYPSLALEIMSLFSGDVSREILQELIETSYSTFDTREVTPLVQRGDLYILELFHGPTLAFKDVALQFLGNLFAHLLKEQNSYMNILGATSGDTGSAAIYGVKGKENIDIFILHPHGRVSKMQALQMTTVPDKNCFNLAIEGTFDDCQAIVKSIFNDLDFKKEYRLGAINSINWARVLAQVVYYVYAALKLLGQGHEKVSFSVPTGNFGDIFAGYVAKRLLPSQIDRLILATNENNILTRFVVEGLYEKGQVVQTISPSMDIQIASNFERYLYYLFGCDADRVRRAMASFEQEGVIRFSEEEIKRAQEDFASYSIDQDETVATIGDFYRNQGYVCDPHTAVGVAAARRFLKEHQDNVPIVCLATAHPCKFPEAVEKATGKPVEMPERIKGLEKLPQRYEVMPPEVERVKSYVREHGIKK